MVAYTSFHVQLQIYETVTLKTSPLIEKGETPITEHDVSLFYMGREVAWTLVRTET